MNEPNPSNKLLKNQCIISILAMIFVPFLPNRTSANELQMPSIFGDGMVLQEVAKTPLWGRAAPGEKVTVQASWASFSKSGTADAQGNWKIYLDTPKASFTPHTIDVKSGKESIQFTQVLIGQVWLCSGQSNMAFVLSRTENASSEIEKANFPNIRLYQGALVYAPTPLKECKGVWQRCQPSTAAHFPAVAYYFGKELYQKLDKPIGLINLSWGGTPIQSWMRPGTMDQFGEYQDYLERYWKSKSAKHNQLTKQYETKMQKWQSDKERSIDSPQPKKPKPFPWQNQSHYCYNGMIAPIAGYAIAGVIWYQGEANTSKASFPYYQDQFTSLINDWRNIWKQDDLPFLFVQLSSSTGYGMGVAHVRQAQLCTFKQVPNTGMAVTMDIGDASDHHPKNKRDVGYRLSLWALKNCYGDKEIVPSGPIYHSKKLEGNKIRLFFEYADEGLMAKGGELTDFAICGMDQKFCPAKAVIEGNTVVVSSEKVPQPQHASFAWCEYTEPNFYNKQGLPASPFNTLELYWQVNVNLISSNRHD